MMTDMILENTISNLKKNNFSVYVAETKEEGAQIVCSLIDEGATIGVGGSVTIKELDILDELDAKGHLIFDHNKPGISPQQLLDFRRRQLLCDVFLTSTNALTETGELVNIDGFGNRVAALSFGPKRVIVAAGINKLVPDVEAGIERVKNIAAPMNAKRLFEVGRLKKAPPCVKTGHCIDCRGPERICTITNVTNRRPFLTDIHIVIIKEELGY
ncbi:MAG: lactate utilization protein [Selenomonadales bacterium]|nr:lactate utilization protein [Selenomonadales bacterium]